MPKQKERKHHKPAPRTKISHKTVELIAAGYEWVCPKCGSFLEEIEITETVTCPDCNIVYRVADYYHATKGG